MGACDALETPHPLQPLHDIARSAEVAFGPLLTLQHRRAALFDAVLGELQRSRDPEGLASEVASTDQLPKAIAARLQPTELYRRSAEPPRAADNLSQCALVHVLALENAQADAAGRAAIGLVEALPPGVELAAAYRVEAQLRMLNRDCDAAVESAVKAITCVIDPYFYRG